MRRFVAPWTILLASLTSCGACHDETVEVAFFEPETYGTYELQLEPDIRGPSLVDFGVVDVGEPAMRTVEISNVGRLRLDVDDVFVSGGQFAVDSEVRANWSLESRESRTFSVTFTANSPEPVRDTLVVESNDPDEPRHTTVLVANRSTPCLAPTGPIDQPTWQIHGGEGPQCWPERFQQHGQVEEYRYATIPPIDDPGWEAEPHDDISFSKTSSLCDMDCGCLDGGEFTYFQTLLYVPREEDVGVYQISIRDVDDGARVTLFNESHPSGLTPQGGYAFLGGGTTSDLAAFLVAGLNRVVITHVDDCCRESRIRGVTVTIDDDEIDRCD